MPNNRNNTFENSLTNMFQFCNAIISIDPVIRQTNPTQSYHRDIRIKNNKVKGKLLSTQIHNPPITPPNSGPPF